MKGNTNLFNYQIAAKENVFLGQNSASRSLIVIYPEPDEKGRKMT